jgi:hypothetical protein
MEHIRAAGLCARGARAWFARHGFDWSEFIAHGIAAERLEATGDHYARIVCTHARKATA